LLNPKSYALRFELTLLGTAGGAPTAARNCSAAILRTEKTDVLIDCAEGTQRQLLQAGIGMGRVSHILITHLHGDHYFGLAPLLSSLGMQGRVAPLVIVSPLHLRPRLNALLELDKYDLPYELTFHTVHPKGLLRLPDIGDLEVFAFPLQHRICPGPRSKPLRRVVLTPFPTEPSFPTKTWSHPHPLPAATPIVPIPSTSPNLPITCVGSTFYTTKRPSSKTWPQMLLRRGTLPPKTPPEPPVTLALATS